MSKKKTRKRVQLFCKDEGLVKQSFKNSCDINMLMKRFKKVMPQGFLSQYNNVVGGQYGDFSNVPDYRTALDIVSHAEDAFMTLPAQVRKEFANDPALFLDAINDPKQKSRLQELGLVKVSPPQEDTKPQDVKSEEPGTKDT